MDFFKITLKEKKGGVFEAGPDFVVGRSDDLMVRGGKFYAIWDEDGSGLWSTDDYAVQRIVDKQLKAFQDENKHVNVKYMASFDSGIKSKFIKYTKEIGDNAHQLDEKLTFRSTPVKKKDYASKRLPYDLAPGDYSAWDEIIGTLYKPEERAKIEWAIGSLVAGDSRINQKFFVLYGSPGSGKGTIINITQMMFDGYTKSFDAKALGSGTSPFAASAFASNPLLAIQHDGDLSRIEDNTILNMIVSHETFRVNVKYTPEYDARFLALLIMGTNKPVKITDAQSGLLRRLIDVHPSGETIPRLKYEALMDRVAFQLGAIAHHCLGVYKTMGKNYYNSYRPLEMMYQTDTFFNFIETYHDVFSAQNGTTGKQAWNLYKDEYCDQANIDKKYQLQMHRFFAELRNYFEEVHKRYILDGIPVRNYYKGFKGEPFKAPVDNDLTKFALIIDQTTSLFDLEMADSPAQYAKADGSPQKPWATVKTTLAEIETGKEHYVSVPENLIVIDFDLTGADGKKSLERNLEAAASWPPTYAEISRSGKAVHLHYYYDGDVETLDSNYADGIEVKVFRGKSALRRLLTLCNDVAIAVISTGLPLKEKQRVLDIQTMKSEQALRELVARNLRKEIHPGTKPSIDFIKKILDDAYDSQMDYDLTDMRAAIIAFANNSSNKALDCLKTVQAMRWKAASRIVSEPVVPVREQRLVLLDTEVFPNLFVICWKFEEDDPSVDNVVRMINPKPHEVEALFDFKLVAFNARKYDNHILWGAALGYNNKQLYQLSKKLINEEVAARFGRAYDLSYTDVYDYATEKISVKKWQFRLGINHQEINLPWDEPVPEDKILEVVDYCANDVVSLEKIHKHLRGDYTARLILSDLSGLTPNHTTAQHAAKIVFGEEKNPQKNFIYTALSTEFPGYVFDRGVSTYRGETVGEGGYVYAESGIYRDVALLDVASMHPTTIGQLNLFGEYTQRFMDLVDAQMIVKHFYPEDQPDGWTPDFEEARGVLQGKLKPYIDEIEDLDKIDRPAAKKAAKDLRYGLKIAINIVYGNTSAKFDNPFRDVRNVDNIVAKRGALFMIDLKNFIQERGFKAVHIKTDSVKIPGATPEIIEEVQNFATKYGYTMEQEAIYSKLGLVNDAEYVAKKDDCISNCWVAVGKKYHQDKNPYVYKSLFGYQDDINFADLCEVRSVAGKGSAIFLDFGIHQEADAGLLGWVDWAAEEAKRLKKEGASEEEQQKPLQEALTKLIFVGKVGQFTPVHEGYGGGQLYRIQEGRAFSIPGTKGYLWVNSDVAMDLPGDAINYDYFNAMVDKARESFLPYIEDAGFSSVEDFLS